MPSDNTPDLVTLHVFPQDPHRNRNPVPVKACSRVPSVTVSPPTTTTVTSTRCTSRPALTRRASLSG
jgi:hypothetical protein